MKHRSDFVTNSSSSSFILAFSSKENMESELLKENLPEEVFNRIYSDCTCKSETISKQAAVSEFSKNISWYTESNKAKKWISDLESRLENKDYIITIEYSDDTLDGSELEHDIIPNLKCCAARISYH